MAAPVVLAGCRAGDSTESGDSPEAVHQAMCDAIQAKNWRKMADCFTPESREAMAGALVMMGAFVTMDEKHGPAVEALFKRHGIEEPGDEPAFGQVTEPLTTDVKLSYQRPFFMGYDGEDLPAAQAEPLFATLLLDGKPIAEASRVGFLQIDAARDDKGKQLALFKAKRDNLDVDGDFVDLTGGMLMKDAQRPMEIDLMLERPSDGAKSLALLEGSLKLVTGGRPEEVLIRDIKNIEPETAIENQTLKSAGVTLRLSFPVTGNTVSLAAQGPIWSMDLVDGKGKKVDAQWASGMGEFQFQSEPPLPADVGLQLVVLTGQKPETVPFKFEGVPLPGEGEEASEGEAAFAETGPSEEDFKEWAAPIKDKAAFIAEMFALLEKMTEDDDGPPGVFSGKLADLQIEGDTATAVQVTDQDGNQQREPIEFRRINGRWFVHLPKGGFSM
jgi:hypothetical protein